MITREQRIEIRKILLDIRDKFPEISEEELYECIKIELELITSN